MHFLITGGSRGIGKALRVLIESKGHRVTSWSLTEGVNITNSLSVQLGAKRVREVDVLINCAGIFMKDSWDNPLVRTHMEVNFEGTYSVIRHCLKAGTLKRGAHIYNLLTQDVISESTVVPNAVGYTVSKMALKGLAWSLNKELKGRVEVINLYPPLTKTDMLDPSMPMDNAKEPEETAKILWNQIWRDLT